MFAKRRIIESFEKLLMIKCYQIRKIGLVTHQKVDVGNDQEKAQSEKDFHSENRGGKNKLTIRYLYYENIS